MYTGVPWELLTMGGEQGGERKKEEEAKQAVKGAQMQLLFPPTALLCP